MADTTYRPSPEAVEAGARAYVQWINPPHSVRQPTEVDRQHVRAVLVAAAEDHEGREAPERQRKDDLIAELRRCISALERRLGVPSRG